MTFVISKILSQTVLKGIPSSFTLELPPYRKPQIGKIIVRSIFDRTLFVLGRAVSIAAPTGIVIWLLANIGIHDISLLEYIANFFEPFARLMGLDRIHFNCIYIRNSCKRNCFTYYFNVLLKSWNIN